MLNSPENPTDTGEKSPLILSRDPEENTIQFEIDPKIEGSDISGPVYIQQPAENVESHEMVYTEQPIRQIRTVSSTASSNVQEKLCPKII